jgi:hypothetical protein
MTIACASLLLASSQGAAATTPSSKYEYPCDVYDSSFCFRKPWNSVVNRWSGPDFEVYNVATRDEDALFSVYVGRAPQTDESRIRVKKYKTDGVRVDIGKLKNADGAATMDILIQTPHGDYLHIFGASDEAAKDALAGSMTGFRRCERRGVTSLDCETKPLFDEAAAELVRNLR